VFCKPGSQLLSGNPAGGQIKHQMFLFIDRTREFTSVQKQEYFHRGMRDAFVASTNGWFSAKENPSAAAF
jgi:hypothetical protein